MKKNIVRLLSMFLCAAMLFGMAPTGFAAEVTEKTAETVETEPDVTAPDETTEAVTEAATEETVPCQHVWDEGAGSETVITYTCILCGETRDEEAAAVFAEEDWGAAAAGTCGPDLNWDWADGVLTISGTGKMDDYPDQEASPWYPYRASIDAVIIEGAASIGDNAFCAGVMTSVSIPDTVTSIGDHAFYWCMNLTDLEIPDSVTRIESGTFYYCRSLTEAVLPESLEKIGDMAFYYCDGLTSVTLPASVTAIGFGAFDECTQLKDVYYSGTEADKAGMDIQGNNTPLLKAEWHIEGSEPGQAVVASGICGGDVRWTLDENGVLTLSGTGEMYNYNKNSLYGYYGYQSSITSLVIQNGVTAIGTHAFQGLTALRTVEIAESVTAIGEDAFQGCKNLTGVEIPSYVTVIENWTFNGCWNLAEVTIPNGVTSIGMTAFGGCRSLTELHIPSSVTYIGESAFSSCEGLKELIVPESVTALGNFAFTGCGFTSAVLPDSVLEMGESVFKDCANLETVVLPAGLTSIPRDTFRNCGALASIEIPASVTSIGDLAFYKCASLSEVRIPEGVATLGGESFGFCNGLKTLILPKSVTFIGPSAFNYDCHRLKTVYYAGSPEDQKLIDIGSGNQRLTYDADWVYNSTGPEPEEPAPESVPVYRLYNPYTLEHIYTSSKDEWNELGKYGWTQEGIAWYAPEDGTPVYRLYNPYDDGHFYTMDQQEIGELTPLGWQVDGVITHSAAAGDGIPVYRLFNPYETKNYHHYTVDEQERDYLVTLGWRFEGVAWYAAGK